MSNKVKVVIANNQTLIKVPKGVRMLIRRCCNAVMTFEKFVGNAEVSIQFVDNNGIRMLNKKYRNIDKVTDVLSFPLGAEGEYDINHDTGDQMLGDIVISIEKAMEQAERFGHGLSREIGYLTVHSMLHLLGYNHEAGGIDLLRMREKEEECLAKLGLERDGSYYMEEE